MMSLAIIELLDMMDAASNPSPSAVVDSARCRRLPLPPPPLPGSILIDTARPSIRGEPVIDNRVTVLAHSAVLVLSKLEPDRQ